MYDTQAPAINVFVFTYAGKERVVKDVVQKDGYLIGNELRKGGEPTNACKSYRIDRIEGHVEKRTW